MRFSGFAALTALVALGCGSDSDSETGTSSTTDMMGGDSPPTMGSDGMTTEGVATEGMSNPMEEGMQAAVPVDFTEVRTEEISATRAVVRFNTSVPTTCEADYGLAPDMLNLTATDPNMADGELTVTHEVPLEDLMPDQLYYWRARATDADGVTSLSETFQFMTMPGMNAGDGVMTNVALAASGAGVMDVSSNFGGGSHDSTWGANKALDGMMATEWATAGDGDDAWLMVGFGQMRRLDQFTFRSRAMADGSSIIQSVRLVFDNGMTMGPFMTPDPTQAYTFPFDPPVMAGSVRVEAVQTTGGNTGAREIQFSVAQ